MNGSRVALVAALASTALVFTACGPATDAEAGTETAASSNPDGVPTFTVDPTWPLEMPNQWIMGAVTAVFVDAQDHVWVAHLP